MILSGQWQVDAKKVSIYFFFFLFFIVGCFLLSDFLLSQESKQFLASLWDSFSGFLIQNGPVLFLAIAFLPALILPVSPLLALAGIWGESKGIILASALGSLSLVANCCWTYWFARVLGLKVVNRFICLMRKNPISIPEKAKDTNFFAWALVLRLTPGIPFIFGNYILGALKMPFHLYLLISAPILTISSFGYIFATAGLISGDFINFAGGAAIILCIFMFSKYILKMKKNAG